MTQTVEKSGPPSKTAPYELEDGISTLESGSRSHTRPHAPACETQSVGEDRRVAERG